MNRSLAADTNHSADGGPDADDRSWQLIRFQLNIIACDAAVAGVRRCRPRGEAIARAVSLNHPLLPALMSANVREPNRRVSDDSASRHELLRKFPATYVGFRPYAYRRLSPIEGYVSLFGQQF